MKKMFVIATVSVATSIALAQAPKTTTATAPAQTTTATAPAAATVATKPWSLSLKMLADVNAAESRTLNAEIFTENTIGFKYKVTPKDTVSLGHVFYMIKSGIDSSNASSEDFASDPVQAGTYSLGYRRSLDGTLLGSKLAPGLTLTNAAFGTATASLAGPRFRNYLTLDNNFSWTISPLFSVDYLVYWRTYLRDEAVANRGQAAGNRFLQSASLTANVNDAFSLYQAVTTIHGFDDGFSMRETRQRLALETGMNYSPAVIKGLALNLNINTDMNYSSRLSSVPVHKGGLWESNGDSNIVLYEASASYAF